MTIGFWKVITISVVDDIRFRIILQMISITVTAVSHQIASKMY